MRISAKADYAVRAAVELAAADELDDPRAARSGEAGSRAGSTRGKPVKAERIATAQGIPLNFLENILGELRHAGIVRSHRGADGGFRLARPANEITVADVIRAVEGPLASVRGGPPEDAEYAGGGNAPAPGVDRRARQPSAGRRAGDDRRRGQLQAPPVGREADRGSRRLGYAVPVWLTEDPGAWVTR